MDSAKVFPEHPDERIEPLQGRGDIHQQQVAGMMEPNVRTFVIENLSAARLPVRTREDGIPHPAERDDVVVDDIDADAVLLGDRLPAAQNPPHVTD